MIEKKIVVQMESVGYYRSPKYSSLTSLNGKNMYGAARVVVFILGIVVIPCTLLITPLYIRHKIFNDVIFAVTESDVLEIKEGISSIFCQGQTIKMNSTFNAFQIDDHKVDTNYKKHFRLRKSMILPDDSLEYWGFFLNKGSTVNLSLCSRYDGGRIMVVKDLKDFHSCGLLEKAHKNGADPHVVGENEVQVVYDPNAEVIRNSDEQGGENYSQETLDELKKYAEDYLKRKIRRMKSSPDEVPTATSPPTRRSRSINDQNVNHLEGFLHGKTNNDSSDSSVSSFENDLISCHEGRILLNNNFTYSHHCTGLEFLENRTHIHTKIQHEVHADGYYFYIFYSDNDIVKNSIHTIFDIAKPTYEYSDYIRGCLNKTECTFPISFLSREKVVVEIPMMNGIEHEGEEVEMLISSCQPRTLIYAIFPIAVLIVILTFSFV
ncbi:uncharacterized protein LOC135844027 isoform X2 [Planococcus citri]